MAQQPAHWPDQHDDDPPVGVSIRPIYLDQPPDVGGARSPRVPDQLAEPTIPAPPGMVDVERGGAYGEPGASALANYHRRHAAEWARFLRSLPWRLAGVVAAGAVAGMLASSAGPRVAGAAAAVAAGAVGWLLRFRVSADTAAWRRGARGERRTARALRLLLRAGWSVLHDVAVPGSRANADHLLIGPPGVFLVDSKAWHGHITLGPDGLAWHNGHPMDEVLDTVRWEARQVAGALGVGVLPLLCVHDARLPWGELFVAGEPIVPVLTPARLVAELRGLPAHLDQVGVMLLAEHARRQLHPAA
jgi:Nuclease-related domain